VEEKSIQVVADVKAAKVLDISVQTLRNWRHMRKGPTYLKIGRSVRYRLDDLNTFMENNRIDPDNQK
jgi:hypothetical protein